MPVGCKTKSAKIMCVLLNWGKCQIFSANSSSWECRLAIHARRMPAFIATLARARTVNPQLHLMDVLFHSGQLLLGFQPEFEVPPIGFARGFPFLIGPLADFLLGHGLGPGSGSQGPRERVFFFHDSTPFIFLRVHTPWCMATLGRSKTPKKADVIEHLEVFDHVGLLVNWRPGIAGAPF